MESTNHKPKKYRIRSLHQKDDCRTISEFDRERIMRAYYRYNGSPRLAAKSLPYGPRRIRNVWLAAGFEIKYHQDYKGLKLKQDLRKKGGLERKL